MNQKQLLVILDRLTELEREVQELKDEQRKHDGSYMGSKCPCHHEDCPKK